jgi:hypothetical protein
VADLMPPALVLNMTERWLWTKNRAALVRAADIWRKQIVDAVGMADWPDYQDARLVRQEIARR